MYLLQRKLSCFSVVSLIVIFSLMSTPCCICGLFVSNSYAAQSDNEAVVTDEEQVVAEATQENGKAASDTAKDSKTNHTKTEESADVMSMSLASGSGGGDNAYGSLAAITDISQSSGSASAKIPIEVPPGRLGMAPKLTLRYNSYRGNGRIGMGWDIDMGSFRDLPSMGLTMTEMPLWKSIAAIPPSLFHHGERTVIGQK